MYKISEDGRKKLREEMKVLYTLLGNLEIDEHKEKYLTTLYYCKLRFHLINCIIDDEINNVKNEKGDS